MKYLKLKEILRSEGDEVAVEVVGKKDSIKKEFNGVTKIFVPLEVLINGESYEWETSEDQRNKIKEAGCGAKFVIRAYKTRSGYIGFNYIPQGDVSLNYGERKQVDPKVIQDDFQDKVSRGAAWNNAFSYVLKAQAYDTVDEFCENVAMVAETVARHQKAFVNGETVKNAVTQEPPLPEPPPGVDPLDDLPF